MIHRLCISALILFAAAGSALAEPDFSDLEKRWQQAMKDLGVPGLAVAVVQGDRVILERAWGVTDAAGTRPLSVDSPFYIASCTKTYNATAIMMLVEEGKLALDDPVIKHLPKFALGDASLTSSLTICDLLSHAKGLENSPITFGEAYTGDMNDERFYRVLPKTSVAGKPSYSNLHYAIVGRIIEAKTGMNWRDFLAERIATPLGMDRTTAYASKLFAFPDAAIPIIRDGNNRLLPSPARKTDRTMHAAGGMGASVRDMSTWLRFHINGGEANGRRLLSSESIARMQQLTAESVERDGPPFPGLSVKGFGLAWAIADYNGRKICRHGGGFPGARSTITFMPEEKIGIAAATNIGDSAGPLIDIICFDVYNRLLNIDAPDLLPELVERRNRSEQDRAAQAKERAKRGPVTNQTLGKPLAAVAGDYDNADWGRVTLSIDGSKLKVAWGDLSCIPLAGEPGKFTCIFERVSIMEARLDGEGDAMKLIFQSDGLDAPVEFVRARKR